MNTDSVLQAILLLCSFFNKSESRNIRPLTPTEYSRLATWLHQNKFTPADFVSRQEELLSNWQDPKKKITKDRLTELLQRAASMGFALEKWQQQNVWVLSRASQDYPRVLRDTLGDTRSPLLYGIGNKELLRTQGIGFVGSRDTNADDESFTQALAQQAVEQGFTVVSGGAKGVDQTSMIAALDAGGFAIGVLADSLLKAATKPQYRKALQEGRLLLITPYYPEASFSTGTAMGRNKYIYSLSKGVVVVKSDEKGGTWTGANENLKKQWVPLWVRDIEKSGNKKLIELGGEPLKGAKADFNSLHSSFSFKAAATSKAQAKTVIAVSDLSKQDQPLREGVQGDSLSGDLFSQPAVDIIEKHPAQQENPELELSSEQTTKQKEDSNLEQHLVDGTVREDVNESTTREPLGVFLDMFYEQLQQQKNKAHTPKELAEKHSDLSEAIIKKWLNKLEEQGLVSRQGRKLLYTVIAK